MEIQYINGRRVVIGAPFESATVREAKLAEALATATNRSVRATLPNGMRLTVNAK